jgi:hypothetical protein
MLADSLPPITSPELDRTELISIRSKNAFDEFVPPCMEASNDG